MTVKKVLIAKSLTHHFPKGSGFLERADVQVFVAASNGEVLKIHRQEAVDVIVSELNLPGIPSEDLFSTIRQWKELREVSVILICEDTVDSRKRCDNCHANAVLFRPLDTIELNRKVLQFLNVAPRISYRAALAVAISGTFRNVPVPFWTENISASGMLIKAEEPLAKGDRIFLSFFLPNGEHVSGYGEIVRLDRSPEDPRSYLYGVTFTKIGPDTKAAIEKAVEQLGG